ncbi:MAG: hypothetical protein M0D55_15365 [Elusimicrobiota bacterium]|nr:MAG: hypothetical protein M0D55_15365 [Elusimicrobiota bacterium]
MFIILGLLAAVVIIAYKRATEIVTVNPMAALRKSSSLNLPEGFGQVLGAIKEAAEEANRQANQQQTQHRRTEQHGQIPKGRSEQGRAAIRQLVSNNRFHEAIALYRRVYGVDAEAAKKAVDEMMLGH